MSLTDGNSSDMIRPVSPMYGGGNGGGFGFGGDSWGWVILLLLIAGGGWGNGFGFGGGMGGFAADGAALYPWMNQANLTSDGFQNQLMNDNITSIRDGVHGLSTQLCNCCSDVQMSLANGFAGVEQGANARQIANMQQAFAAQTAMAQGFNGVNSGVSDLRYTVATEACADRAAVGDALQSVTMQNMGNTNAIVSAITAGIQSIKDDLCQDRLDAERRENQNLRSELMYARGQASQVEQTAQILANNNAQTALFQQGLNNEVDALYNRLNTCPVPTTPVYGRTPIFTCNNNGCGCGCGNGSF